MNEYYSLANNMHNKIAEKLRTTFLRSDVNGIRKESSFDKGD